MSSGEQYPLDKLTKKQLDYCEKQSAYIWDEKRHGDRFSYAFECGKLRGFLEELEQRGRISEIDLAALYLWFYKERVESMMKGGTDDGR